MSQYITRFDGDFTIGGQTYALIDRTYPANPDGTLLAHARATAQDGVSQYLDSGNKDIAVTGAAAPGWFVNTSTNAAVRDLDTATDADRHTQLVKETMRRKEATFDPLFAFHDNAVRAWRGYQKKTIAFDQLNAGNATSRPFILAAAAVDGNEFIRFVNAQGAVDSGGNFYPKFVYTGNDQGADNRRFYVYPGRGSASPGGVNIPAALADSNFTTIPTLAQLEAADVFGYLRG